MGSHLPSSSGAAAAVAQGTGSSSSSSNGGGLISGVSWLWQSLYREFLQRGSASGAGAAATAATAAGATAGAGGRAMEGRGKGSAAGRLPPASSAINAPVGSAAPSGSGMGSFLPSAAGAAGATFSRLFVSNAEREQFFSALSFDPQAALEPFPKQYEIAVVEARLGTVGLSLGQGSYSGLFTSISPVFQLRLSELSLTLGKRVASIKLELSLGALQAEHRSSELALPFRTFLSSSRGDFLPVAACPAVEAAEESSAPGRGVPSGGRTGGSVAAGMAAGGAAVPSGLESRGASTGSGLNRMSSSSPSGGAPFFFPSAAGQGQGQGQAFFGPAVSLYPPQDRGGSASSLSSPSDLPTHTFMSRGASMQSLVQSERSAATASSEGQRSEGQQSGGKPHFPLFSAQEPSQSMQHQEPIHPLPYRYGQGCPLPQHYYAPLHPSVQDPFAALDAVHAPRRLAEEGDRASDRASSAAGGRVDRPGSRSAAGVAHAGRAASSTSAAAPTAGPFLFLTLDTLPVPSRTALGLGQALADSDDGDSSEEAGQQRQEQGLGGRSTRGDGAATVYSAASSVTRHSQGGQSRGRGTAVKRGGAAAAEAAADLQSLRSEDQQSQMDGMSTATATASAAGRTHVTSLQHQGREGGESRLGSRRLGSVGKASHSLASSSLRQSAVSTAPLQGSTAAAGDREGRREGAHSRMQLPPSDIILPLKPTTSASIASRRRQQQSSRRGSTAMSKQSAAAASALHLQTGPGSVASGGGSTAAAGAGVAAGAGSGSVVAGSETAGLLPSTLVSSRRTKRPQWKTSADTCLQVKMKSFQLVVLPGLLDQMVNCLLRVSKVEAAAAAGSSGSFAGAESVASKEATARLMSFWSTDALASVSGERGRGKEKEKGERKGKRMWLSAGRSDVMSLLNFHPCLLLPPLFAPLCRLRQHMAAGWLWASTSAWKAPPSYCPSSRSMQRRACLSSSQEM